MKKIITIDDIMIAFVSALGYGFGETLSRLAGWPPLACIVASMVVGMAVEILESRIVFSKAVQKKPRNRFLIYGLSFLIFLIAQYISIRWLGVSMVRYFLEEVGFVIGMPILGFILTLLIRAYRTWRIRQRYGDGSEGFLFDVDKEEIDWVNQQNLPISGEYDAECAVTTRTGIFVGKSEKKHISFLGIPYAKPPVGELRWKAPEPLPASKAVFEAQYFGASAIQVEHTGSILKHHRQSEDCLTLNICVGKQEANEKRPVLVLFHHGDFTYGGSVDPLLSGENFVDSHPDILFVSFNYRLGILGFIDFSQIPGGEACPDTLNLGLLDQIAALKWIRENIAAFGGDPERITALGFESGATCILMLAASGQAKGLFQRAFIFNGNPETVYDTPEGSRTLAEKLMKETHARTMAALSQLDTQALKHAAQKLWNDMCAPTYDEARHSGDLYCALRDGAASGIEFIIGIPGREMQVYRSFIGNRKFKKIVSQAVKDMESAAEEPVSAAARASATGLDARSKLVQRWIMLSLYRTAVKLSEGGNKVHLLFWDEKPLIDNLGSGTVDVAAVLLGNDEALQMYGSMMNAGLSETLQGLLRKFISGNALKLYNNEIKGVDALNWKAFPHALIVSDGELKCETVDDRLADVKQLLKDMP